MASVSLKTIKPYSILVGRTDCVLTNLHGGAERPTLDRHGISPVGPALGI